ncbi:MAG: hypothetical protein CFH34_00838 [Alphaproteobacteria bacterium MarineAlpha9_Bin4]|nr:hypothetical protein [Pelagibacterales bacterium]PPR26627.1 MAG: hypothetical protein CFH34_00838 [Alphaproteobacteria bacterium MarineAlpha9_Bin4]|tara:strand:- start:2163 stop:2420 length:258 start_codon:yes stop_codon:yes gene_type:complete
MKKNHSFKRNKGKPLKKQSLLNNNGYRMKPENKPKGKPIEIMGKYEVLARDATSAGDRIAAENYMQHAEHYLRIINANKEKKVDN